MDIKRVMTGGFQLTLAIIKPHVVKMPTVLHNIRSRMLYNSFYILNTKEVTMAKEEAARFYEEHNQKFFHNRLVTLMSSGPLHVHILAKENAIQSWRELMGPTKVFKTQFTHPDTIRGKHGLSDTRNAVHGSDSMASAAREIEFFFPGFDTNGWIQKICEAVNKDAMIFDEDNFIHHLST